MISFLSERFFSAPFLKKNISLFAWCIWFEGEISRANCMCVYLGVYTCVLCVYICTNKLHDERRIARPFFCSLPTLAALAFFKQAWRLHDFSWFDETPDCIGGNHQFLWCFILNTVFFFITLSNINVFFKKSSTVSKPPLIFSLVINFFCAI